MSALNITKNNFNEEVVNSEKTVLLDFGQAGAVPAERSVQS